MTNTVLVHSFRRGTGKSTIAANVGTVLAQAGQRVGLIDADLQTPSLLRFFGLDESHMGACFNDYLLHSCDIEQAVLDLTPHLAPALRGQIMLIPASSDPRRIRDTVHANMDCYLLHDAFTTLISELALDALIIDTHAGLHEQILPLMTITDVLAIVLRHDQQDYEGTRITLDVARHLGLPALQLIVNEALDSSTADDVRSQIVRNFGHSPVAVLPHCNALLELASADLFALRHPYHPLTATFRELASAMCAPISASEDH